MTTITASNTNPAGNPTIGDVSDVSIAPPAKDVLVNENPNHTEGDLMGDLAKATRRVKRQAS